MTPGVGYWVHVPSDTIWTVTSAPPPNDPLSEDINPPGSEEEITGSDEQQFQDLMESSATQPDTKVNSDDNQEMSLSQGPSISEMSGQASVLLLMFAVLYVIALRIRKRRE
jgi:hypothetical protein